jgi:hypothetical protein
MRLCLDIQSEISRILMSSAGFFPNAFLIKTDAMGWIVLVLVLGWISLDPLDRKLQGPASKRIALLTRRSQVGLLPGLPATHPQ